MTRQKKEIIKRIEFLEGMIEADEQLGCGMAPAGAYDATYELIYGLQEELARLRRYETVEDMLYDMRALGPYLKDEGIPFK